MKCTRVLFGNVFLSALVALLTPACAVGSDNVVDEANDRTGTARIALTEIPSGVGCVEIVVQADTTTRKLMPVTPGTSVTISLTNVPNGWVTITGSAYELTCSQVSTAAKPAWLADPITLELRNDNETVTLVFHRNMGTTVTPDFRESLVQIEASEKNTFAVTADGRVYGWGANEDGLLGTTIRTPQLTPKIIPTLSGVVQMSAGARSACATLKDGSAICWGNNQYGQLGDGTATSRHTPSPVRGLSSVRSVTVGLRHSCALQQDSQSVLCWGSNGWGQLGDGTTTDRSTPRYSRAYSVADVKVGNDFTCIWDTSRFAECWGYNYYSNLGDGTGSLASSDIAFVRLLDASTFLRPVAVLATGPTHSCAALVNGTVACWGDNSFGQLGDCSTSPHDKAVVVQQVSGVVNVAVGSKFSCSLSNGGQVNCWGNNTSGQLGDATGSNRVVPAPVVGLGSAVDITAGDNHACALLRDGSLWCWGENRYGQMGDSSRIYAFKPVRTVL